MNDSKVSQVKISAAVKTGLSSIFNGVVDTAPYPLLFSDYYSDKATKDNTSCILKNKKRNFLFRKSSTNGFTTIAIKLSDSDMMCYPIQNNFLNALYAMFATLSVSEKFMPMIISVVKWCQKQENIDCNDIKVKMVSDAHVILQQEMNDRVSSLSF